MNEIVRIDLLLCYQTVMGGGGGGGHENSQRKWPNSHTQKLFLRNGKIVYYQDILQLPVPVNTLHAIHLNA